MASSPHIICLGEALLDSLLPLGCDISSTPLDHCDNRLGGAPANVACALARLGSSVAFVGSLGVDDIGDSFSSLLNSRGVNLSGLQRDLFRPSRIVLVSRDADGDRSFHGFIGNQGLGFSDESLDISQLRQVWPSLSSNAQWLLLGTIFGVFGFF